MRLSSISGRKRVEFLKAKGALWRGKHLYIKYLMQAPRHPLIDPLTKALYVGVLASAKLDKSAVKRNRMRRRCREALRTAVLTRTELPTMQLLLLPRSSSLHCEFSGIQSDIAAFLSFVARGPSR